MRCWVSGFAIFAGVGVMGCRSETTRASDGRLRLPAAVVPTPLELLPDLGSNRADISTSPLVITDVDGRSVTTVTAVSGLVSLGGTSQESVRKLWGGQGRLFVESRRASVDPHRPWYVQATALTGAALGELWQVANVPLGRHGGTGTNVEVRVALARDHPSGVLTTGYFAPDSVTEEETRRSPSVFVQLGVERQPRVAIRTIDNQMPRPGQAMLVLRKALVECWLTDIPSDARPFAIVHPTDTERRYATRQGSGDHRSRPCGREWEATVFLGRSEDELGKAPSDRADARPDTRDDNKWFWVYVVAATRELPVAAEGAEYAGITAEQWEQLEPYIVASSPRVRVLRTREWGEPSVEILHMGGKPVVPGGEGAAGSEPLSPERVGPVQGAVEANGVPGVSDYWVWLIARPVDDDATTDWRVVGGPWPVRSGNSWGRDGVVLCPSADCKDGKTWVFLAALTMAKAKLTDPLPEMQLNSFVALSSGVTVRPVGH